MKKETLIAVIFGILLGLILAVGILTKTKERELEKSKPLNNSLSLSPTLSPEAVAFQNLEISEPSENIIVNKKSVSIKGKANKDSLVIIQSPIKDMVLKQEKSDFSIEFPLAFGENIIKINVYPKDRQLRSQEKELRVYYFDEQ